MKTSDAESYVPLRRCRSLGDRTEVSEDESPPSIPFLTRHIQSLKKRVRRFEDQFEQEMNYKVNLHFLSHMMR